MLTEEQTYGTITPPENHISVSWSTKGTHTLIKLLRNTQGGDSIYMYSYGIEYRSEL